jgi:putative peptidoglycan lipid II flippase
MKQLSGFNTKQNRLKKLLLPLQLGFVSLCTLVSNLLIQLLVVTKIGPGYLTDAFYAGMTVPQLFTTIISSSLTSVLVPLLVSEPQEDQRRDAWTLSIYSAALFTLVAVCLILTASWWVPETVPGFSSQAKQTTVELARISLLGMIFTGITAVQFAISYAQRKHLWADSASLFSNLISIILLSCFLSRYGIRFAAWTSVSRFLVQSLMLLPVMGMPSVPAHGRPMIQKAWKRLKPILLASSFYKLDPLVDRFLVSSAFAGSVSLLYLAQQFHSAASNMVSKALVAPSIPRLALAWSSKNKPLFNSILIRTLWALLIIYLLAISFAWFAGLPIFTLFIMRGDFTAANVKELWELLLLSSGMLLGGGIGSLTAGAFYSQGDTRTPAFLGTLSFLICIGLKVVMYIRYGVYGLAVAISMYYLFSMGIQLLVLRHRHGMTQRQ